PMAGRTPVVIRPQPLRTVSISGDGAKTAPIRASTPSISRSGPTSRANCARPPAVLTSALLFMSQPPPHRCGDMIRQNALRAKSRPGSCGTIMACRGPVATLLNRIDLPGNHAMDIATGQRFIEALWEDSILPTLSEYIRIPNKSPHFDPHWQDNGHMDAAVQLIADWCR